MPETFTLQRIEAANVAEHEKALEHALLVQVQLPGTKVIMDKARAVGQEVSFVETFDKISNIISNFEWSLAESKGKDVAKKIADEWRGRINTAFGDGSEGWLSRVAEVFRELNAQLDTQRLNIGRGEREKAGSIGFDLVPARKELEKFGIDSEDETLELHLEEFYKRGEQKSVRESILKDLGRVAEIIVDQFPHAKAVTGFSWLLDHPLTAGMGFQVVENLNGPAGRGGSTWMQFIDRNGQISQERVKKFLESGELPMKAKLGFIPVVDFLQRYLPAERRGLVTLQETREGWLETKKQIDTFFKGIKENWDGFSIEDLKTAFDNNTEVVMWLEKAGVKEVLQDFLFKAKQTGKSLKEFRDTPGIKEIDSRFQQAVKIDKSRSYTVEI